MEAIKALQEKRATQAAELKAFNDAHRDKWDAEAESKWGALNTAYDETLSKLTAANDTARKAAERETRLAAIEKDATAHRNPRIGRDGGSLSDGPVSEDFGGDAITERDGANALQAWLLGGKSGRIRDYHREAAAKLKVNLLNSEIDIRLPSNFGEIRNEFAKGVRGDIRSAVRNDLSGTLGSTGGYTFGETFITMLEQAMLATGGVLQVADLIRTASGEQMNWPTADDTSNTGEMLGESASIGSSVDPSFGRVSWYAHKFSSKLIKVPQELLEDSAFNLPQVLSEMLGKRLGRIQNTKYTIGIGGGVEPRGIATAAAAGITSASSTAILWDEIIDLEHSLDPSRRNLPGVGYMFHDSILKVLRKLKDGNGQYLWQSGANSGAPDTMNRYPYTISQEMASSLTSGAISMLFGQLNAYKVRQVNDVRLKRLDELYAANDQVGFIAFIRGDGNLLDAGDNPVKKLTQV